MVGFFVGAGLASWVLSSCSSPESGAGGASGSGSSGTAGKAEQGGSSGVQARGGGGSGGVHEGGEGGERGGSSPTGGRPSSGGSRAMGGTGETDPGGDGVGAAAGDGAGGGGGAPCEPKTVSEACTGRECGLASDGCGDWLDCGGCPDDRYECTRDGACEFLPGCGTCGGSTCGRTACPVATYCGSSEGKCGTFEVCILDNSGTANVCRGGIPKYFPGQSESCCATKSEECSVGFPMSARVYAVSFVTGRPCGTCVNQSDGATHQCGPGWGPPWTF